MSNIQNSIHKILEITYNLYLLYMHGQISTHNSSQKITTPLHVNFKTNTIQLNRGISKLIVEA